MDSVIVLFNLKEGADPAEYQAWARSRDLVEVNRLPSVDNFRVLRCVGLLGGTDAPPYQYAEVIDLNSMEKFGEDIQSDTVGQLAAEFGRFAENPVFIHCQDL
ncbi:MAG: REDY-like protein HapK [Gammaproteobacteria bacterium]|nr:REDY-like protein HapK [Gammaproteobacteria bacterium]MYH34338.1 REDY-like protein HapK [Gammaproteobacteria bacterium]MYL01290.1 REDY-like protein HapK [Gammaproteobacteria bacterium]